MDKELRRESGFGFNARIKVSLLNLSIVAFLGMMMRSKMLFEMPFINYNYLINAHSHFAFAAWCTLILMALMVHEILSGASYPERAAYKWLLAGVALTSYAMLLFFLLQGYSNTSIIISTVFILLTYVFGWLFIADVRRRTIDKTALLLAVSSVVCLVLSSVGPFSLAYLLAKKSLNGLLYRDALFTYLHLQYNGFFTLAVFALLFHKILPLVSAKARINIHRFSVLLCLSIIPSLFLSYLWQDPDTLIRIIAIAGSILVILSSVWFIIILPSILKIFKQEGKIVSVIGTLSMIAFLLKMVLHSLTIFPSMGNAVFGDRPIIIGFLHLVFLGFVTLFLLSYLVNKGQLNIERKLTRIALVIFSTAIVLNEATLMGQGLGALLIKSSQIFTWMLWIISIGLFTGALLIAISAYRRKVSEVEKEITAGKKVTLAN